MKTWSVWLNNSLRSWQKSKKLAADVLKQHPDPSDFQMLPGEVEKQLKQWVSQVPVIGFNSGKYDLNMVKE